MALNNCVFVRKFLEYRGEIKAGFGNFNVNFVPKKLILHDNITPSFPLETRKCCYFNIGKIILFSYLDDEIPAIFFKLGAWVISRHFLTRRPGIRSARKYFFDYDPNLQQMYSEGKVQIFSIFFVINCIMSI